jgi:hypothetical protein
VKNLRLGLLLALLCIAAYAPALNNGFIADDYVQMKYSDNLRHDFFFLFKLAPMNFRTTSIALYGVIKTAFGYRPEFFYAFNILLHFANACLLARLLMLTMGDRLIAFAGASMFAVFQAPQEAIMWLTGMPETLQGLFVLCTLVAWLRHRYFWSAVFFFFALFSKESALMVLALVPMLQWQQRKKLFPPAYGVLWIPVAVFVAVFLHTWSANHLIQKNVYVVGPVAGMVVIKTLLRLVWPWLVVLVVAFRIDQRRWPQPSAFAATLAAMTLTILPYVFLTYSAYLPSRQVYMASMILVWLLAWLYAQLRNRSLQVAFATAFVSVNLAYLWFQKDPEFERRAAPTTQLLQLLRSHRPEQILIFDFPYPEPDIAKDVSFLVPGWTRDLVGVHGTGESCTDCLILHWDARTQTYVRE